MDIFNEQLVTRRKSPAECAYKYGVILIAVLLIFLLVFGVAPYFIGRIYAFVICVPLLASAGVFYLAKKYYGALDIEFEYSLTNGQFDVDKIMNRTDRKRLITFECAEIDNFNKYDTKTNTDGYKTRIFAANADSDNLYYFVVNTKATGKTIVIIEPNEKMIEGIKRCIPRQMYFDVLGRN